MSYLVFARKFRPQDFEGVVGQELIVTTLKNAIKQGRVPQNFLFSGPRGVGKTSMARILAKALNCQKGLTENPCQQCPSCTEITQGNSLDVLEIDGASNRGIDEIRNLRETVKFKPIMGRTKIYVIDEVHMLTTEAFNALLKTLEEPPPHVKFIFATTEPHKVPLTILSRCQRFSFKRIPTQEIARKLQEIARKEKLKFEKNALFQIAKSSDGSLRDAESLLDQLVSFSDERIKEEDVLLALGLAPEEIYFSMLSALIAKDGEKIFSIVGELYNGGRDLPQFARGLLEIFRHLLLFHCTNQAEKFIEMSEEGIKELRKRKNDFSRGELLLAMSLIGNLQGQMRRNVAPPKVLVETTLLKLMHLDGLRSVEDMVVGSEENRPMRGGPPPIPGVGDRTKSSPEPGSDHSFRQSPPSFSQSNVSQPPADQMGGSESLNQSAEMTLDYVASFWPRVIDYVKAKRMSAGLFLSESEPVEVSDRGVTLGFPAEFQFHKEMLEKNSNRVLVVEAFRVVIGQEIPVLFVVTSPDGNEKRKKIEGEEDRSKLPEIINQAMGIFEGAKIIRKE